ncbi:MAG: zinc ribbon-containing protein [Alteromonadaceae bacterium]|nr:zinc ribbon-containing protein [Alteromonadaceae bacterium]
MVKEKIGIEAIYDNVLKWIEDVKEHEVTHIVEVIEKFKAYLAAAEAIPEKKVQQFINNFENDLKEFYQQNQAEFQHSVYIGLLNETFWAKLAQLTDKSQVEWAELTEDFKHQGKYHTGDFIGFGELECQKCHHKRTILHFSEVTDCDECGGNEFVRLALMP